ncbi:unnamed protein product [Pleuronectes platessa]|uniref:Uncharacterized protein n=1 Tax=Pleuronectes platessa TaxID=8262 RepID=A0A9N7YTC5_PLEPL|nr:unnamed protein product [Pleuronectes platessa]
MHLLCFSATWVFLLLTQSGLASGLISSEDKVDCRLCPAGFSCDPANGTLFLCPPGQHSPEGGLQCLACPVDSVCTSGFPHKCGPGKEPSVDHTVCNDCAPGFYSTVCTVQCLQCPAGGYCPDNGTSQPLPCPPGWSSTPGQTHCRSCNDTSLLCGGAVPPRWNQPLHRSSQPITCRPGTYKDTREELACVICPIGHYCVGGVAQPCPAGTYGPKEGLQRLRDCTICPAAPGDPSPSSCAHRVITVKKARPPLMGHLALLEQRGNNWVRQVGQRVRDVEKDASVLQAHQVLACPVLGGDIALLGP